MNSTIAAAAVATQQAQTRQLAQISMMKTQHESELAVVDMLAQAVESAPTAEGVGGLVDRQA